MGSRPGSGVETVALLAEATLESLRRLTEFPAGTPSGWWATPRRARRTSRVPSRERASTLDLSETYSIKGWTRFVASSGGGVLQPHGPEAFRARRAGRPGDHRRGPNAGQGRHRDAGTDATPGTGESFLRRGALNRNSELGCLLRISGSLTGVDGPWRA